MKNKTNSYFHYFADIGFLNDKETALNLFKEVSEVLHTDDVDYCLMFGTLLGKLRHNDFIPWDDDIDIIIFDIEKFESVSIKKLEKNGYIVFPDRRPIENPKFSLSEKQLVRCGYRIYQKNGSPVPGQKWKFPWIGVWEPNTSGKSFSLPPEENVYLRTDFFPLKKVEFKNFPVHIPKNSEQILTEYFGTNNWMEYCIPPDLNHRKYEKTNAPHKSFLLKDVIEYLNTLQD